MIEVVYGICVYSMTNVARGSVRVMHIRSWVRIGLGDTVRVSLSYYIIYVSWLGLGARLWDRIGLGDKVRVSISYYLT